MRRSCESSSGHTQQVVFLSQARQMAPSGEQVQTRNPVGRGRQFVGYGRECDCTRRSGAFGQTMTDPCDRASKAIHRKICGE